MGEQFRRFAEMMKFDNPIELTLQRVLFRKTKLQTYRFNGVEVVADLNAADTGSIQSCIAGPMYRKFLSQMTLAGPLTVADFGANAGGFSALLKVLGLDVQRLLCVELNPNTYERLRFNITRNFRGASVVNAAVCGVECSITVPLGIGSTNDNIYTGGPERGGQAHTVPGRTFDDLCDAHLHGGTIDICKMDIEGAEVEILASGTHTAGALDRCRYFLIELHPVEQYDAMASVLHDRQFRLVDDEGKHKCGVHLFHNTRFPS